MALTSVRAIVVGAAPTDLLLPNPTQHQRIIAICNQLSELAQTTIPRAGDALAGADAEYMETWLDSLSSSVAAICEVAHSSYPYDNTH